MNKKIVGNTALVAEIRHLRETMSPEDVLESCAYREYLISQAKIALGKATDMRSVDFQVWHDKNSDLTACTSGELISCNTVCPLTQAVETLAEKDKINQGKMFHEVGHRFFTDFAVWNKVFDTMAKKGKWYKGTAPADNAEADKVLQIMQNKSVRSLICKVYHSIANIFEDEYIEWRMTEVIGGEYLKYLQFTRFICGEEQIPCSEAISMIETDQIEFIAFVMNSWLVLASHRELTGTEGMENHPIYQELIKILDETEEIRFNLATESNTIKRAQMCSELLCVLLRYVEIPPDEQKQNGNSGSDENSKEDQNQQGGSGSSGACNSDGAGLARSLGQMNQSSKEANGNTSPVNSEEVSNQTTQSSGNPVSGFSKEDRTSENKELNKVFENLAEETLEYEQGIALQKEVNQTYKHCKIKGSTLRWDYEVEGQHILYGYDSCYEEIYGKIKGYAMRTKRILQKILKDKVPEGLQKGYSMGRFNTSSYVNHLFTQDGKAFARINQPENKPDVVFGLLIDQSGSMNGCNKKEEAIKSAILFADVLSSIDVPHLIVGHNATDEKTYLIPYHDFNGNTDRDKFKLVGLRTYGCNRDGAAISYMCEKLKTRPEKHKVLIVITDGEPSSTGFHTECEYAEDDTKKTIEEYSKKKINIFGAVIDGDMETMNYMYGDRVLDLRDLEKLPITLASLVKRYIK